jgi:hypothetical protein
MNFGELQVSIDPRIDFYFLTPDFVIFNNLVIIQRMAFSCVLSLFWRAYEYYMLCPPIPRFEPKTFMFFSPCSMEKLHTSLKF